MRVKVIVLAVAAALVALAAYLYLERASKEAEPEQSLSAEPPAVESPPEIRYPVPEGEPGSTEEAGSLPPIDDSDPAMLDALVETFGEPARNLLVPDSLVRRIVATIDGLPRQKLAARIRPVTPAPGPLVTAGVGDDLVLDANNHARYAPFVRLVEDADVASLVDTYYRFYPRFQEAYEQLGYPSAYFNDRLVEVIDDLLATPDLQGPIDLVRPNVLYEFADPELEARSVGQKVLLRMGPENESVIKIKLREIRDEVTSHAPPG